MMIKITLERVSSGREAYVDVVHLVPHGPDMFSAAARQAGRRHGGEHICPLDADGCFLIFF